MLSELTVWVRITATSVMIDVGISNNDDVLDVLGGDINSGGDTAPPVSVSVTGGLGG